MSGDRGQRAPNTVSKLSARSWRARELAVLGEIGLIWLVSRVLVYLFAGWSQFVVVPSTIAFLPETQTGLPWWLEWGTHWDGAWYLSIVREGYHLGAAGQESNLAFWPLYPALLKGLTVFFGQKHLALLALAISNVSLFFALWVLRHLVALDASEAIARRTVVYIALFPTSFFYSAYYPESLFLLGLALAWYCARSGRIWQAGLSGGLAALTHVPGALLMFPLLWESLFRTGRLSLGWARQQTGLLLVPAAVLGFLAYLQLQVGDAFAFFRAAQGWNHAFAWPWAQLIDVWGWVLPGGKADPREVAPLLFTMAVLAVTALSARRMRAPYLLWIVMLLLLYLSVPSPQPLISMPRYTLQLFPVFVVLAQWGERPWVNRCTLLVFVVGLGVLTSLFARWHWVG